MRKSTLELELDCLQLDVVMSEEGRRPASKGRERQGQGSAQMIDSILVWILFIRLFPSLSLPSFLLLHMG